MISHHTKHEWEQLYKCLSLLILELEKDNFSKIATFGTSLLKEIENNYSIHESRGKMEKSCLDGWEIMNQSDLLVEKFHKLLEMLWENIRQFSEETIIKVRAVNDWVCEEFSKSASQYEKYEGMLTEKDFIEDSESLNSDDSVVEKVSFQQQQQNGKRRGFSPLEVIIVLGEFLLVAMIAILYYWKGAEVVAYVTLVSCPILLTPLLILTVYQVLE